MKKYLLRIITKNQRHLRKAEDLALKVQKALNCETEPSIEKYYKFEDSYKIEFIAEIENPENSILECIEKSDRLCSPWVMTYFKDQNEVQLLFNKTDSSIYRHLNFNTISWAYFEVFREDALEENKNEIQKEDERDILKEEQPFSYKLSKDNKALIYWNQKMVMVIKGKKYDQLMKVVQTKTDYDVQLFLAKLTGNFKRGNEKDNVGH